MKVLVVSPHADDAEIGMCGTILKLVKEAIEKEIAEIDVDLHEGGASIFLEGKSMNKGAG